MNRWWSIKSTIAAAFCCWWAFNAVRYRYGFVDSLLRSALWPLESTHWTDEFSEDNFDQVKIGMTEDDVVRLMGKPLRKTCNEGCELVYTWQIDSTSSFDRRMVDFGKNGLVEKVRRDFFID